MADAYDLSKLDPNTFEHLVNTLMLRVLGAGHTGFGPGPDGGRDGYFEGEAPYPSETDRWAGRWYIQCKFHKPHLSKDAQAWLLEQISDELNEFKKPQTKRKWPDNWIVASNIDPSGTPMTGAFDRAREMVADARSEMKDRFHIWGGSKIIGLLTHYPNVAARFGHFLTPGNVLSTIYNQVQDSQAHVETILRYLIVKQFDEQQHTKLEQAGYSADSRPGIHRLFIDLPFRATEYALEGPALSYLVATAAASHRIDPKQPGSREWVLWRRNPARARVWFIRGGPGRGKSTIGQYFCQIQRAALILQDDGPAVLQQQRALAEEVRQAAAAQGYWPTAPRVPVSVELKSYAQWLGHREDNEARGILTYLAERIRQAVEQEVLPGTLKRALGAHSWFVVFDGLDEVPHDVKHDVASAVRHFIDSIAVETDSDLLAVCTSRPQGYSGQFAAIDGPVVDLLDLPPHRAILCAEPVLALGRSQEESRKNLDTLKSAINTGSVRELMSTPLQCHIMALVVRDGGRPPERRWKLYNRFYEVTKAREANRDLPDRRLAKLLREDDQVLRTVHNRLGFVLHARAETSEGAQTSLSKLEFRQLATEAVAQMVDTQIDEEVDALMRATTDRLVLVSTPDDGDSVRFDIRSLQEFFAAEFLYDSVDAGRLRGRLELISGDSHWREVIHFLMSALVENNRRTELTVATDVLERLNEGDGGHYDRLIGRRLGLGAIVAIRLLEEGVLEGDKRIRQQFRRCLEPIRAFTALQALSGLAKVQQPNSQSWLLSFLVDMLEEAKSPESIGAAIVLGKALPDGHNLVARVSDALLGMPTGYLSFLLQAVLGNAYRQDAPDVPDWLVRVGLKLLFSDHWSALGLKGIDGLFGAKRGEQVKRIGRTMIDPQYLPFLDILLGFVEDASITREMTELKAASASYLAFDCKAGPRFVALEPDLSRANAGAPGVLRLVYWSVRFASSRSQDDLTRLAEEALRAGGALAGLPHHIKLYIPVSWAGDVAAQLRCLADSNRWGRADPSGLPDRAFYPISASGGGETKLSDIDDLLDALNPPPWMAVFFLDLIISQRARSGHWDALDLSRFLKRYGVLRAAPGLWGGLLRLCPGISSELRQAFLEECRDVPMEWQTDQFSPFELELPREAAMLPLLLEALVSAAAVSDYSETRSLEWLAKNVKALVKAPALLNDVINDPRSAPAVRAAATIMLVIHPEGDKNLAGREDALAGFYVESVGNWYPAALALVLRLLGTSQNEPGRALAGRLIERLRGNFEGLSALDPLLEFWRETSLAPLQTAAVEQRWLSGAE